MQNVHKNLKVNLQGGYNKEALEQNNFCTNVPYSLDRFCFSASSALRNLCGEIVFRQDLIRISKKGEKHGKANTENQIMRHARN